MNKKFFMKCINPTQTLQKGKFYEVVEFNFNNNVIKIINDWGFAISVFKNRFSDFKIEDMENKKLITCINTGKFRSISLNSKYQIIKDDGKFYTIKNDNKIISKYGHRYFKRVDNPVPVINDNTMKCIIPTENLTYHKRYEIKTLDNNYVEILNDVGEKVKLLSKRFTK